VLAQVVDAGQEDDRAALRVEPHEALALERGERLAHRRRADAEAPGDLDLAELRAGQELAGDDLRAQPLGDQAGDGAGRIEDVSARGHKWQVWKLDKQTIECANSLWSRHATMSACN
jgi:hypothetical protein